MGSAEAERLRQLLVSLAQSDASRDEKVARFQQFASKLEASTAGSWQAARIPTTDGSEAFLGRLGEVVVFTVDGGVFRGRVGSYRPRLDGIELDYSKLVRL